MFEAERGVSNKIMIGFYLKMCDDLNGPSGKLKRFAGAWVGDEMAAASCSVMVVNRSSRWAALVLPVKIPPAIANPPAT